MTSVLAAPTAVDPITTEVIRNAFLAAAEDMRVALGRSAFTPVIYEMKDFSVGLFDARAEVLGQAPGLPFFVGALGEVVRTIADKVGLENFRAGDAFVLNDSYITGSHLNDVCVVSPVIYQGETIGFTATKAHWLDIGAKAPGYAIDSTETYQEGIRLGPVQIAADGQLLSDLLDTLARNSRMPRNLVGDLAAQVTACRMGERRLMALADRFGLDTLWAATARIFTAAEQVERDMLAAIPDGVYEAEGYQDNDFQTDEPFLVKARVTVSGTDMIVDTSGSSGQRPGATNCGYAQTLSAARLAYKFLVAPAAGVTGGSFRALRVITEPGSVFHAQAPTGCQQYGTHTMLLVDLIIKALAPAIPTQVAAGLPGDSWNVIVDGRRRRDGSLYIQGESTAGGWGANAFDDGESAVIHSGAGDFRNLPIETLETRLPVRVHRYAVGQDSGGAGRFRGGLNVVREYEFLEDSRLTLWFERTVTPQWGLFGGGSGAVPDVRVRPGGGEPETRILKLNHGPLPAGTRFTVRTGGGGGYGPPWQRDLQRVREDVLDGYVSVEAAERQYGVVFVDGAREVDLARTETRRTNLAREDQNDAGTT